MKMAAKYDASTAKPVAAMVNHTSAPVTNPAINAGVPVAPRDGTRATRAVTPGHRSGCPVRYHGRRRPQSAVTWFCVAAIAFATTRAC
jgi:hypothetical protein